MSESLARELELLPAVKDSSLAASAMVLARMLDDAGTADTARTSAARELRETLGVLRAAAGGSRTDRMTEFERRSRERDERRAAQQ